MTAETSPAIEPALRQFITAALLASGVDSATTCRMHDGAVRSSTSSAKQRVWREFAEWASRTGLSPPFKCATIASFLGQKRTQRSNEFISYAYLRTVKATVVRSLKIANMLDESDITILQQLTETVRRERPDQARYDQTFDVDEILSHLADSPGEPISPISQAPTAPMSPLTKSGRGPLNLLNERSRTCR